MLEERLPVRESLNPTQHLINKALAILASPIIVAAAMLPNIHAWPRASIFDVAKMNQKLKLNKRMAENPS
jgi:hypothetical protein